MSAFKPLKSEIYINNFNMFNFYPTESEMRVHHKDKPVNALYKNNLYLC